MVGPPSKHSAAGKDGQAGEEELYSDQLVARETRVAIDTINIYCCHVLLAHRLSSGVGVGEGGGGLGVDQAGQQLGGCATMDTSLHNLLSSRPRILQGEAIVASVGMACQTTMIPKILIVTIKWPCAYRYLIG